MGNYGINMNKQLVFVAPIYKVYSPSYFFSGWAAPTSQKLVPRFTESHSCLGVKHYGNQGIPSEYPALCHQPGRSWKVLVRRSAPRQNSTHHCAMFGTFHTWYSRCCTWCCHVWEHACGIIWMHASGNCQLFQLKLKGLAFSSQTPHFF